MKHLWKLLLVLLLAAPAWAGTTSLTGTVFDASNNPAVNGFVRFTIQPQLPNVVYRDAGTGIIVRTSSTCNIQSNGTILDTDNVTPCKMFDNDTITPANSFYKIELAPGGVVSDTFFAFITGATADLSTLLLATPSTAVPPPSFSVVLLPTISGDLNVTGDVTVDGDVSVGSQFIETIVPVSFSATPTFDANLGSIFTITLTGNVTSSTITNAVVGQIITIYVAQDATGGRTFAWPVNVQLRKGGYTVADDISAVSVIKLYYDGTNWREISRDADEFGYDLIPVATGQNVGSDTARPDGIFELMVTGRLNSIEVVDGNRNTTLQGAHDNLPAGGGTVDGHPLQGAQTISATVAVTKPTQILLDAATFTSSVAPAFSFDAGSDGSSMICTAATKITFANSIADSSRLVRIQNTSDITIKGCELDGNGNNATAGEQNHNIIITGSSTDVLITENTIHDAQGDGILIGDADRVTVTRNTFFNLGRHGVTLFGPTINNISVTNNKFRVGVRVSTSTAAGNFVHGEGTITVGAGRNITVSDNQLEGQGISLTTGGAPWSGVQVKGNVIRPDEATPTDAAILLRDTQDFTIEGNEIIGSVSVVRVGIHVQEIGASSVTGRGVIANNVVRNVGNECISISGTFTPALGQLSITGNVLTGCGDLGIQVETEWPDVQITNNIIRDSVDFGIDFQDSQDFVIAGNILIDNGTRGIQVQIAGGTAAGRGLIYGNEVRYATPAGTQGINIASNAGIDRILVFGNDLADTATPLTLGALATNLHAYMNRIATSGPPVWTSEFELDGDFNHDGTNAGFFGVTPAARPSATDEIKAALALLGLLTDAGASPLDLDGGLLTAGGVVATAGVIEYTDAPTLAASTTPSVTGGNVFLTNSTASITDFTGEQNGQVIILLCGADTTTSLVDSTPLFLSAAFTCTANDTITLVSNGTVWYETSRSVN